MMTKLEKQMLEDYKDMQRRYCRLQNDYDELTEKYEELLKAWITTRKEDDKDEHEVEE